ncbi:MAG: cytochrome c biogenesis protein ResB [Bacteriovoracales bacterium]|nr:cytochrome c biogenesis protein ResB [Bacteriovoracales bacterium]
MLLNRIEKILGSAKFAFVIILSFAALMAVGTFFESTYGTEFAGRAVYKSPFFMGIQGLMLLSIFYSLLHRFPAKKAFYGFYTIHIGLIVLFSGSFITWYAGIDGQITLSPGTPSQTVILGRDMLSIVEHDRSEASYVLPYTPYPAKLDETWKEISLVRYLPFSEDHLKWMPSTKRFPSSRYLLFNENVSQELVMSLHPQSTKDFPATSKLGPLEVHYLPPKLLPCFRQQNPSGLILFDTRTSSCKTAEEENISLQKTKSDKRFFVIKGDDGKAHSFFPELSPWPLLFDEKGNWQPIKDSKVRVFSKKLFTEGPRLFLFGKALAYYRKKEWVTKDFQDRQIAGSLQLPWMGLQVQLLRHEEESFPRQIPSYERPVQVNNELIKGEQRALKMEIRGRPYWVTSDRPLGLALDGQRYSFYLQQQTIKLPFEINLTSFKMDTDPGTNNPASYESFVSLFSKQGVSHHHIFMNNPLKFSHFTFYQASYFQMEDGRYGSVLSVNFDPGRWWKYLGSLLIVLGSIWHFYLRRAKTIGIRKKRILV